MDEPTKKHDNTETGRKRTKRNFTNDGKKRTGRDLADTLYKRGATLVTKQKELLDVTNAPISITIKPLTDHGDVTQYISPNFNETAQSKVAVAQWLRASNTFRHIC